jgi:ferredoxin-nitrite reductase
LTWLTTPQRCPGLFYGTAAQDGFLIRIRTPGGLINHQQGKAIASLAEQWGNAAIQITNRANLQIRSVQTAPTPEVFQVLQDLGLAAQNPSLDHLRNLMTSPTAGIDAAELLDTRPLVQALDTSIQSHAEWAGLPAKFSIGIDGGGTVGIGIRSDIPWEHRYNEIQLSALSDATAQISPKKICFQLALGAEKQLWDTQVLIQPEDCVFVVAALTRVYLDYVNQNPVNQTRSQKPRMKHLLQDWGMERYLQLVNQHLQTPIKPAIHRPTPLPTLRYGHLGIHSQQQPGLSYIGISLRLGSLTVPQWTGLIELSETFGSRHLRLTPWQTVLLPDIPDRRLPETLSALVSLGLWNTRPGAGAIATDAHHQPQIVDCGGQPGCAVAATQTQRHGLALSDTLPPDLVLSSPVNIHLSGCPKSCAQPSPADITLLGTVLPTNNQINKKCGSAEGYHVYLGIKHLPREPSDPSSRQYHLCDVLAPALPFLIEQLLTLYQQRRKTPQESFSEFTSRCPIPELQQWIASAMCFSSIESFESGT